MSSLKYWKMISDLKQRFFNCKAPWIVAQLNSLKLWKKISRLTQCFIGGLATYIIALLSNGPGWFTTTKIAAGIAMFFSIWGASVWHYGRCREIYAKKHWDPVYIENPKTVLCVGASGFAISILISLVFLPAGCVLIAVLNAITIMFLYARFLDQYWPWKNVTIALICITPILFGWLSGHRLSPVVPPLIFATFFFYVAREIFKDITDLEANKGRRFTMVMDIGIPAALKVGGAMLTISLILFLSSFPYLPDSLSAKTPFAMGVFYLSWFAVNALKGENIAPKFSWMDVGVGMVLICLLSIRFQMY